MHVWRCSEYISLLICCHWYCLFCIAIVQVSACKWTLEKTEGAIKKEQSRDWAHKTHDEDKQNSKESTTQHRTLIKRWTTWTPPNLGENQVVAKGMQCLLLNPDFSKSKIFIHKSDNLHRKSLRKKTQRNKTPTILLTYARHVWHHYSQTNTNNISKTWAPLQTTWSEISIWSTTLSSVKYITMRKNPTIDGVYLKHEYVKIRYMICLFLLNFQKSTQWLILVKFVL
jgi:hypothetical protein